MLMKAIHFTDQDYNLLVLLAQTSDAVLKAWQKELDEYNISVERAAALLAIRAIGDEATPSQISRWLSREPHTVSGLLNRMGKAGLVMMVKDLDKKNMVRVVLTNKGRKAYHQSIRQESIHQIMVSLSEEERQQLRSCLQTLRDRALT